MFSRFHEHMGVGGRRGLCRPSTSLQEAPNRKRQHNQTPWTLAHRVPVTPIQEPARFALSHGAIDTNDLAINVAGGL